MRIAVIGAGVSGLVAAYRLQLRHEVVVFEAAPRLGGHACTVDVPLGGARQAVDVGFMVFNQRTYPNFCALLAELGVKSQSAPMSFSVCDPRTGFEFNGQSLNTVFAQRRNLVRPSFYRLLWDILRFHREAKELVEHGAAAMSVDKFLRGGGYSKAFADYYLLPMGSAIWSCPRQAFGDFQVEFVARFFFNHGLLDVSRHPQWRVIQGGSRRYVDALAARLHGQVRVSSPIARVVRRADGVELQPRGAASQTFDHVVFACHADDALRMLGDCATALERDALSAFQYGRNALVLHTDERLLPRRRRAWAAWNYRVAGDRSRPATVTYNLSLLQSLKSQQTLCATLNEEAAIRPGRVLQRFVFRHPLYAAHSEASKAQHPSLVNANRASFCGAYWRNGFHEDGVVSAMAVVAAIDAAAPKFPPPSVVRVTGQRLREAVR